MSDDVMDGRSPFYPPFHTTTKNTHLEVEPLVELLRGAEHLGEEEVEERPQLVQAVWHGRGVGRSDASGVMKGLMRRCHRMT